MEAVYQLLAYWTRRSRSLYFRPWSALHWQYDLLFIGQKKLTEMELPFIERKVVEGFVKKTKRYLYRRNRQKKSFSLTPPWMLWHPLPKDQDTRKNKRAEETALFSSGYTMLTDGLVFGNDFHAVEPRYVMYRGSEKKGNRYQTNCFFLIIQGVILVIFMLNFFHSCLRYIGC